MKKILILLITLSILIPFNISAKDEKVLTIDLSKYTSVYEMNLLDGSYYQHAYELNLLQKATENDIKYITNSSGKKLMTYDNDANPLAYLPSSYRILDGIGENDKIEYTVPLNNEALTPEQYKYDKVVLKFGPQDFSKEDYIIEVRPGYKLIEDYSYLATLIGAGNLSDILTCKMVYNFKSLSGKLLFTKEKGIRESENIIRIPSDVTKDDDIIYILTEEEKEELGNEFDKIIINFSGYDYNEEERTYIIDMHDIEQFDNLLSLYENYKLEKKFKTFITASLESPNGKKLAYLSADDVNLTNENMFTGILTAPTKIYDGVGEEDTIYYNIPDSSEIRTFLPSNYKRIIIKFIPEEKITPTKTNRTILVNPQTLNNLLIIFSVLIAITASTILIKKQNY